MSLVLDVPKNVALNKPGLREAVRLEPGTLFYSADGDLHVRVVGGALRIHDESTTSDRVTAALSVVTEGTLKSSAFKSVTVLEGVALRASLVNPKESFTLEEEMAAKAAAARLQKKLETVAPATDTSRLGG